jgi:peptidoglycan/xylan/chitin deacetylase (PgdA/CDA1 family)
MFKKNIIIFLSDVIAIIYFLVKKMAIFFTGKIPIFLKRASGEKRLRILVYHSVSGGAFEKDVDESNVSPEAFIRQMEILKKTSEKIVSLAEGIKSLEKRDLSGNAIAITFDDGLANAYNEASRILKDRDIPATFFLVNNYLGRKKCYMNWENALSLKEKGFGIGSHSYSHRRLSALKGEELDMETVYAKKKFEERGINVEYFAYPYGFYGDFSKEIEAFVKKAGYKACLTNIMGENIPGDNLFRLKRTRISWRDTPFRFKMKINGAYDWVDALKYKLSG